MSFDELKQWVVRWYYEDWANRTLTRHLRSDFRGFEQFGGCPAKRWQAMTGRFAYAIPLSPARAEWRMALYEHETRTLSRKTGITYRTFNYRGQALQYLIDKYGERTVKVYANPDDYRQVFVDDGDEAPLVALTEEYVDDSSPAYSFKEAEAALKGTQPSPEQDAIRNNFQADVHDKSANAPKAPASKTSKAQRNRDVVEKVKADDAAKRAATTPLQKSTPVPSEQGSTADLECDESAFDDVTAVPVRSRTGGEAQT